MGIEESDMRNARDVRSGIVRIVEDPGRCARPDYSHHDARELDYARIAAANLAYAQSRKGAERYSL
jgi:hypothetical protein